MRSPSAFWFELRRRNVVRAAVLYVGAVWALAQGMAQLAPVFGLPDSLTRWFVLACTFGFPFWLALAWLYELTPTGLKRESATSHEPEPSRPRANRRLFDYAIIAVLAIAVVLLLTNQLAWHRGVSNVAASADTRAPAAALARAPDNSVAVLPLANESGDPKQQYFSDGLSEELISDLTQVGGLKVIGKYSSFRFRDSRDNLAHIGAALGVAHLIQGSVFRQGDRIRVTIGMVRAVDGSSVWSHAYDAQLQDVFAIQAEIGRAVAAALKVKLLGRELGVDDEPPSRNVEAYRLMLQGRAIARHGSEADYREAIALYRQALKLDPDYAYAWGLLSFVQVNLGAFHLHGSARERAFASAMAAVDRQQALAPHTAATHVNRGYLLSLVNGDAAGSLAEFKRAYALAPNSGDVMNFLSGGFQLVGQLQQSAELMRKALALDPLRADWYASLAYVLLGQRQLEPAERAVRQVLALQPSYPGMHATMVEIDLLRGDAAAAERAATLETDPTQRAWALALAQQADPDQRLADAALDGYVSSDGAAQPYLVALLYAFRQRPDAMFEWLRRAWQQGDPGFAGLLSEPLLLVYRTDPRFAALCEQARLPSPASIVATASGSA